MLSSAPDKQMSSGLNKSMMKKVIVILGFLMSLSFFSSAQNVEEIDGIYYKNSQRYTGTYVTNFDNGHVRQEIKIKNGEKHGKVRIYFENGQLNEIRSYKHNQMDGKWTMYNDHGIKTSIARYRNGEKNGKWLIWNDYGHLLYELQYDMGKKTGVWKKYDEQGNLINKREY